jgi:hypothetical protein
VVASEQIGVCTNESFFINTKALFQVQNRETQRDRVRNLRESEAQAKTGMMNYGTY